MSEKYRKNTYNSFYMLGQIYSDDAQVSRIGEKGLAITLQIKCGMNKFPLTIVGFKNEGNIYVNAEQTKGVMLYKEALRIKDSLTGFHPSIGLGDREERFLTNYDFAENISFMITKKYFKGQFFKVSGNLNIDTFIGKNGEPVNIDKYHVHKIVLSDIIENPTPYSIANIGMYIPKNSITRFGDEIYIKGYSIEEKKGINGYEPTFVEMAVELAKKDIPSIELEGIYTKQYESSDDRMKFTRFIVNLVNGYKKTPITYEMLNDKEKYLVDNKVNTIEEVVGVRKEIVTEKVRKKEVYKAVEGYLIPVDSAIGVNTYPHANQLLDIGNSSLASKEESMINDDELPF